MRIISQVADFRINEKTAVALGKFDGLHVGHQTLIDKIMKKKMQGYKTCVFTFDPSPLAFFSGQNLGEITTKKEKRELFEQMGVDILIEFPLNDKTAAILPEIFISDVLVKQMNTGYIVSGRDVSFGYKGLGNADMLTGYAGEYGYEVELIDKVEIDGYTVSSSLIREKIKEGNMELTARLLGNNYSLEGQVLHGKALGRTIGFPTLNITPEENKLLPPRGVYFTRVWMNGGCYDAITNVGSKPTVSNQNIVNVESHLLNFTGDAYGADIRVEMIHYERAEKKFDSLDDLKRQINLDRENGIRFLENL